MRSDSERRTLKELGFRRWFSEVLIYHYKWHILGAAAVIAVVITMFSMNRSVPKNDATVIVAVSQTLDGEVINELKVEIGRVLGDQNGDGQIIINVLQYLLNPRDGVYDETVQSNATAMVTSFLNDDMVLYLMDQQNLQKYNTPESGRFNAELAAEFGGSAAAVPLGDLPLFQQLGLTGENELFACFKSQPFSSRKSEADFYRDARAVVSGLLAARTPEEQS